MQSNALQRALEVKHRVEPELLYRTMTTLSNVTDCLWKFLNLAEQHASLGPTSIFHYVQDASNELMKMVQSDVQEALLDIHGLLETWGMVG